MDIDSIYNALFEISQGISIQKASRKIKRDARTIKNKIDFMTSKHSKDLSKYQRFQCNNCFKRVTKVKVLHFSKIYDRLLDYRYSRLFLRNTKLQKNESHLKSIEIILDIDIINTKSKEILKKRYQKLQ